MMQQPDPSIPCLDVWSDGLPEYARRAYDEMLKAGEIKIKKVTLKKSNGTVIVEYLSNAPHEWTLNALRKIKQKNVEDEQDE